MKKELKKLSDLEIGDKFYPASQHGKKTITFFIVQGKCKFNRQYGSPTRECMNLSYQMAGRPAIESKSCRMEVMKISEEVSNG